jgi:general secretion pathway protein I
MKDNGFSLPEVLVALLVLSIAGVSLMQSNTSQLRGFQASEQKTLAMIVAHNQLAAFRLSADSVGAGVQSGIEKQGAREYEWTVRRAAGPVEGLGVLEVAVREAGQPQVLYAVSTLEGTEP